MKQDIAEDMQEALERMRAGLAELSDRVARLESADGVALAVPEKPAEEEGIDEETLLIISGAVAAFLGERVHIHQVRLVTSPVWAQQGRVSIQASHRLER